MVWRKITRPFRSGDDDDTNEDDIREQTPPLSFATPDGAYTATFPADTIINIRQMISRLESRADLPQRLGVTAALQKEGTTYIAQALATTLAHDLQTGVCLLSLNWWAPDQDQIGVGEILAGTAEIDDALQATDLPHLHLLPAGHVPTAARPIMARSPEMDTLLNALEERFTHLVIDLPAVLPTSEAVPLANHTESCVVVVRQGVTTSKDLRLALDQIDHLDILGIIMNQVRTHTPDFIMRFLPSE